ncbi:DUF2231 domain-containing protein [Nocardia sp. NPDC052112]|uniref:DUF2231 domain-containing protein n=1 Tax=Nocardia sp. NPDC052112 TaxID=3155646 RepID=UPI003422820E
MFVSRWSPIVRVSFGWLGALSLLRLSVLSAKLRTLVRVRLSTRKYPMSTFNGLPAHILLVHFIVVLAPLTAVLVTACAVWPAVRRRLVWLSLVLATVVVILTPITTDAGEWLEKRVGRNPDLNTHAHLGDTFIYFAIGLLIVAALVAVVHVREARSRALPRLLVGMVAVLTIAASVAATVQVYRIGESGSRSVWHDVSGRSARTQADLGDISPK